MRTPKQLHFFKQSTFATQNRIEHGGAIAKGKRKLARPVDSKRPMHVVLRSSRARGVWSLLRQKNTVRAKALVFGLAKQFDVRVYEYANSGNHLHLLVRARSRKFFQNYLRTLAALLARAVTGAKKGSPRGKFWDALAYSRVVEWGKAFIAARGYLLRNRLEAIGFLAHADRALAIDRALEAGNLRCRMRP